MNYACMHDLPFLLLFLFGMVVVPPKVRRLLL